MKKPSFYQVPGKKNNKKTASAANSEKDKSSTEKVENPGQKEPRKPVVRKAAKPATPVVKELGKFSIQKV